MRVKRWAKPFHVPPLKPESRGDPTGPTGNVSRVIVVGFLVAAALGFLTGIGWMGYQFLRTQFGG